MYTRCKNQLLRQFSAPGPRSFKNKHNKKIDLNCRQRGEDRGALVDRAGANNVDAGRAADQRRRSSRREEGTSESVDDERGADGERRRAVAEESCGAPASTPSEGHVRTLMYMPTPIGWPSSARRAAPCHRRR